MTNRYHFNPNTGNTGPCKATKACPFGGDDKHYDSQDEARKAYEETMSSFAPAPTAAELTAFDNTYKTKGSWEIYGHTYYCKAVLYRRVGKVWIPTRKLTKSALYKDGKDNAIRVIREMRSQLLDEAYDKTFPGK